MKIYTNEIIKKKKEKVLITKKILKYIFMPIFILFLIFCMVIAYQKFILKKQNIEIFGYKTYIVLTGSMKPEIDPNDIVIVKNTSQEDIKNGDIITFTSGQKNATVTHRIIEIVEKDGKTLYKTKGDNNNSEDIDLVKYENIQGKYVFKLSKIGVVFTEGLTGTGIIVVFLILLLNYRHSSKMEDRALTREEARKRYNVYKYKDKDDTNDSN